MGFVPYSREKESSWRTGSVTGILIGLKWYALQSIKKRSTLEIMHKMCQILLDGNLDQYLIITIEGEHGTAMILVLRPYGKSECCFPDKNYRLE